MLSYHKFTFAMLSSLKFTFAMPSSALIKFTLNFAELSLHKFTFAMVTLKFSPASIKRLVSHEMTILPPKIN